VNIGRLDKYIDIKSPTKVVDPTTGAISYTLALDFTTPCTVEEFRGKEKFKTQRELGTRIALFTIRFQTGITVESVITYDSEDWDITSIAPIGRREALEIVAEVNK